MQLRDACQGYRQVRTSFKGSSWPHRLWYALIAPFCERFLIAITALLSC